MKHGYIMFVLLCYYPIHPSEFSRVADTGTLPLSCTCEIQECLGRLRTASNPWSSHLHICNRIGRLQDLGFQACTGRWRVCWAKLHEKVTQVRSLCGIIYNTKAIVSISPTQLASSQGPGDIVHCITTHGILWRQHPGLGQTKCTPDLCMQDNCYSI